MGADGTWITEFPYTVITGHRDNGRQNRDVGNLSKTSESDAHPASLSISRNAWNCWKDCSIESRTRSSSRRLRWHLTSFSSCRSRWFSIASCSDNTMIYWTSTTQNCKTQNKETRTKSNKWSKWHKTSSPPHMDGSGVFARWRQCVSHVTHASWFSHFCTADGRVSSDRSGHALPPQNCTFPWENLDPI